MVSLRYRCVIVVFLFVWQMELSTLIVLFDFLFEALNIFTISSHIIPREELLGLVFQRLHEPFSLRMRVKAHRGAYLAALLPWPHVPDDPLRLLRRATINEAVPLLCSLNPITIDARSTEIHARRTHHLCGMIHLLKALAIEVCLLDRLYSHFFYERRYSGPVVAHKTLLSRL